MRLADQVKRLTAGTETLEVNGKGSRLPGDTRALRGLPAVGRISGVVTDSVVPGSDEHLERLST